MPKYRLLSDEELKGFEKEFIEYLIVNGIDADAWKKMKAEENKEALQVVDLFSDVIFEGVLRKIKYLERTTQREVQSFQCLPDQLVLVGMEASTSAKIDFTDKVSIVKAMSTVPDGLKVYTSKKPYESAREMELFKMISSGCEIADGQLFKVLALSLPKNK